MLAILGDIHGEIGWLNKILANLDAYPEVSAVIQVGDFGWFPDTAIQCKHNNFDRPLYFIDGNHEYFPYLNEFNQAPGVHELLPNLFYVARGTVLELDGKKIACMGGASSPDKKFRLAQNLPWFPEEDITDEQISRLDGVDKVDMLITHIPPQQLIQIYFDPNMMAMFELPPTWVDPNAVKVQALWDRLGRPPLYCGHMHKHVIHDTARILDINELVIV